VTTSTGPAWVKSERQLERERLRRRAGLRSAGVASASTIAFLVLAGVLIVTSPGWDRVQRTFLSWPDFTASFPDVLRGFGENIVMFLIAEPLILVIGLLVAMVRSVKAPVFFPLRALAVLYTDLFRGVPTLLLIFLVGFGVPALDLQGTPSDPMVLGVSALVLSYGAYVAEVFRAGIDSVHPSQRAAARSLGLSHLQTMRFVVLPQAIRRVIPPLLNDFISLQKDTALVATLGVVETLRQAQIYSAEHFNYTPYVGAAVLFIALTVPLARFTDYLARRSEQRREAGSTT